MPIVTPLRPKPAGVAWSAAIPALEALCRRFRGFGLHHPVPEQVAALTALAAVGGRDAASAVARIIVDGVVQGSGLATAVGSAAILRASLPAETMLALLRHAEPAIRADACRCAHPQPRVIAVLADLLDDLNGAVASAAACALGNMGRIEARPLLLRLLRENPTEAVIAASVGTADADVIVQLGRIARTRPGLAAAAITALKDIDDPRAPAIITAIPPQACPRSLVSQPVASNFNCGGYPVAPISKEGRRSVPPQYSC